MAPQTGLSASWISRTTGGSNSIWICTFRHSTLPFSSRRISLRHSGATANHDTCYPWNQRETGYSKIAPWTVCEKLRKLQEALPDEKQLTFLHRIDNVLFCHGGLTDKFVRQYVPAKYYNNVDAVIGTINGFGVGELWQDASPLWYRPQYYGGKMYKPRKLLQVVGHTPVETIMKKGNLISCDVFSTYRDGKSIGTQEFLVLDTDNWDYKGIR